MKRLLFVLACLIAFTSAMRGVQINFPPTVYIYYIFSLLFIAVWIFRYSFRPKTFSIPQDLKIFLVFLWIYFTVNVVSGVNLFFYGYQESFEQYERALLVRGTFTVFASFFCLFLSELEYSKRKKIWTYFIAGIVASSIYGILGTILYKTSGFRIESIWNYLSYNVDMAEESLQWAVLGIRRGVGFPGVNASATYNMTIIPFLLLLLFYRRSFKDYLIFFICFTGLAVTLSRTGFVSFSLAMFLVLVISYRDIKHGFLKLTLFITPFLILAFAWWDVITEILTFRGLSDISRFRLWETGWTLFMDNPLLGVGANNFSVVGQKLGSGYFFDFNLHNSWLTILVELGIVGFVAYSVYFIFIVVKAFQKFDILSKGLIVTIVSLSVAALTNQLFDLYYFKFFLVLVFSMIAFGDGRLFDQEISRKSRR